MKKELELWQFVADRLNHDRPVMLLVVADSSGSSPGRAGYKMAVGADGELYGSIGGGVMEVALVEKAREILRTQPSGAASEDNTSLLIEQVHKRNSKHASGMICSGRQTVILRLLTRKDLSQVEYAFELFADGSLPLMLITPDSFSIGPLTCVVHGVPISHFEKRSAADFTYCRLLGPQEDLYIIGGGHCALALSELMSKLDFRISIFDDRPELNTLEKNGFANEINIIDNYESIADLIPDNTYVVVMTLGYAFDEIVIRRLIDKEFNYFGVLGSKAKMAVLLKQLKNEGLPADRLSAIRTPIGLPINSHTPEEIAVSIAAEIIAVKNGARVSPFRRA